MNGCISEWKNTTVESQSVSMVPDPNLGHFIQSRLTIQAEFPPVKMICNVNKAG